MYSAIPYVLNAILAIGTRKCRQPEIEVPDFVLKPLHLCQFRVVEYAGACGLAGACLHGESSPQAAMAAAAYTFSSAPISSTIKRFGVWFWTACAMTTFSIGMRRWCDRLQSPSVPSHGLRQQIVGQRRGRAESPIPYSIPSSNRGRRRAAHAWARSLASSSRKSSATSRHSSRVPATVAATRLMLFPHTATVAPAALWYHIL